MIQFSGYTWRVKWSDAPVGPGPNYFSDAPASVWVDRKGRLHLGIRRDEGLWSCAEVISERSFGFGTYRFRLDSPVDDIDPNAVVGLFTWSDRPDFNHREIDIEISRWGEPGNPNAQFVLQPWIVPANIIRFSIPPSVRASVHEFSWQPGRVRLRSMSRGATIREHTFTSGIPPAGDENARINLWLVGGLAARNGRDVEVVLRRFEFRAIPSTDHATSRLRHVR